MRESIFKLLLRTHKVDHDMTRKPDSNLSNIIKHHFHLVPLPFLFLGLLEGAFATYWHLFVQQQHCYQSSDKLEI